MPHWQSWDSNYYGSHSSATEGTSHRASSHRRVNPDEPDHQSDRFKFVPADDAQLKSPKTFDVATFDEDTLMFAPLEEQTDPTPDTDETFMDEHEIEYDVSAGV